MKILGIILVSIGSGRCLYLALLHLPIKKRLLTQALSRSIEGKSSRSPRGPDYAGGFSILAGVVVLLAAGKKKA